MTRTSPPRDPHLERDAEALAWLALLQEARDKRDLDGIRRAERALAERGYLVRLSHPSPAPRAQEAADAP